jgi:outer membrane protein OmpA-like peptidoglycan-associated protein
MSKTIIAAGVALAVSVPAYAMDELTVEGYVKSSHGETWHGSSGECVRTSFKDTQEFLEECGYEKVSEQQLQVQSEVAGEDVSITETTAIVKGGEVLAERTELVAEKFIKNLTFEFDRSDLTADDEDKLADVVAAIEANRQLLRDRVSIVHVIGHTDSVGSEAYNQGLSERRAATVADFLAEEGDVPRSTIEASGRGELEPIATNDTEEGRATNRRVEIRIQKR